MAARRDDHAEPRRTLFIRNLPFSVTKEKLEEVFSDIGPLRRCFVVNDRDTGKGKGYGFVVYSLLEDAVEAKKKIKKVDGRPVSVLFAAPDSKKRREKYPKQSTGEDEENVDNDVKEDVKHIEDIPAIHKVTPRAKAVQFDSQKSKYVRAKTVVLTGFKGSLDSTTIEQATQNVKNIAEVVYPVKDKSDTTVHLVFKCVRDSKRAVRRLHGIDFRGQKLEAHQYSKEFVRDAEQGAKTEEVAASKKQKQTRLIIRNLSFKCTEEDLRSNFKRFGEIVEAIIPMRKDGKQHGFGFVQFTDVHSSEKAIQGMNMKLIKGRPIAVDWAVPKNTFIKATAPPDKEKKDAVSSPDQGAESDETEEEESSDEEEEGKKADESDAEEDDEGFSSNEESGKDDSGGSESESDKMSDDDESNDESDSDSEDDEQNSKKTKEKIKQKPNELKEGRTLFIRNINFDSIVEDLEELLEEFGEMDYCKFVMDQYTERPRGTAFVQFSTDESAQKCLQKANEESVRGGIVLDGRRLNIILAVSRQDAAKLKEDKKTKEKDDKRNLYLAREGLIRPGTQAAEGLTKADLDKRLKVESVKRQKLKNPNIFISPTRLCIRNIPVKTTDKELKKIFREAAGDRKAQVTECRIMKDMTQVNAQGEAKSRGYGFVEFSDHQHALQALRNVNNNPEVFGEKRRPIVEFSLENKVALEAKKKKLDRIKAKHEALSRSQGAEKQSDRKQSQIKEKAGTVVNHTKKSTDASPLVKVQQTGAKGAKKQKVLPSHWGPKVRKRDQGKQKEGKKPKDKASRKVSRGQLGEKRKAASIGDGVEPKKKKSKGSQKQKTDDFDSMVNKYRSKLLAASSKSGVKWFHDS